MLSLLFWRALFVTNPYYLGLLFSQIILFMSLHLGIYSKMAGFIFFIVYVGGIFILFRYCIMLLPLLKRYYYIGWIWLIFVFRVDVEQFSFIITGLLNRANAVFLIGFVLYLVMLAVVEIVNYSRGILKYDKLFIACFFRIVRKSDSNGNKE